MEPKAGDIHRPFSFLRPKNGLKFEDVYLQWGAIQPLGQVIALEPVVLRRGENEKSIGLVGCRFISHLCVCT